MDLGLKEYEVSAVTKQYGLEKFWTEGSSGHSRVKRTGRIQICVEEGEMREIRAEAKRLGFRSVGDYVLGCVRYARSTESR